MPCCVVRGEDSVRLLVLPRDQRVAGREVRFLTNTMEIEHSFQSIDAGLVYHFFEFPFKSAVLVAPSAFKHDRNPPSTLTSW